MQTVLEVLNKATGYLTKAGLETPGVDAQWLMADALGCRRLDLFLQYDRPLEEDVLAVMRERVKQRGLREPLQYILGYSEFHDIRLLVRPGVLIPRPETEELVDKLVDRLSVFPQPRVVDLGTGSGAIALSLAKALPGARVLAIEQSPEALAVARENAERLELRDRVAFRSGNWLEGQDFRADCIVSNPPYLTITEWETAAPEVRDHEPREALVADEDGTADLRRIIASARERLVPGGLLALETGIAHAAILTEFAKQAGYAQVWIEQDHSGRDRFLFAEKEKAP